MPRLRTLLRRPSSPAAAMTLAAALALAVPGSAAAGGIPLSSLNLTINHCAFSGNTANIQGDQLRIKHRNASGGLKATHDLDVSKGFWSVECPGPKVVGGDVFQLFDGPETTPFRTFEVPKLTLRTDRVRDRVTGFAPRVSEVSIFPAVCDVAFFGCTSFDGPVLPVNPQTHRFQLDVQEDFKGGWRFTVRWAKGDNVVELDQRSAQLVVQRGSAVVGRYGPRAKSSVTVSVRRGQAVGIGNANTKGDASFAATVKRGGNPMKPRAGDVVSSDIAGDAVLTVPQTSIELVSGGVEGRCFKNRQILVFVYAPNGDGPVDWNTSETSDGTGAWEADVDILAGQIVEAWCPNGKGDVIKLRLVAL